MLVEYDHENVLTVCFLNLLNLHRYASIKAIETKSRSDDQQWLTYWVLYSLITLFELTFAKLIEWYGNTVATREFSI